MPFACYRGFSGELETDQTKLSSKWRYVEPFLDQNGTICLDQNVKSVFLGLLLMLQVLSIVWFGMILKVALSMVKGEGAQDTRSSDEDEEEEEKEELEEEGGMVKEAAMNGNLAGCSTKDRARSSGSEATPPPQTGLFGRGTGRIRVPGSRDKKELLGRVGCNG